jgi:hypothetical protein
VSEYHASQLLRPKVLLTNSSVLKKSEEKETCTLLFGNFQQPETDLGLHTIHLNVSKVHFHPVGKVHLLLYSRGIIGTHLLIVTQLLCPGA